MVVTQMVYKEVHVNTIVQVVQVGEGELMTATEEFDGIPGFNLESYPNRDSTIYT